MPILATLAQYGAQQSLDPLSPDVVHHAKRALLDWLAALYPGTRASPGRELLIAHKDELGLGTSRLPGCGAVTLPATAAWINGSMSHSVEFDDIFKDAIYHPGCPIISAALAVADSKAAVSGLALLTAIVTGYEISTRIGVAVQPSHYRYFHTTGTVGCIGAAAAAAALCAPGNAMVMQHAMATAATFASGLQQAFRSDAMTKALHAGHAAAVGVRAGLAAAAGVTGVADIIEGKAGFGAALAENPNWALATDGLGKRYNITRMTQKNHGCCGHTFAAIDAALSIKNKFNIAAGDIEKINIETYRTALNVTGHPNPRTAFEARFSLPYVVCHALCFGSVRLDAFDSKRLVNNDIRQLMKKIILAEAPDLSAAFPAQRAARVTITLNDGRAFEHFAPTRKGDPESPLSDQELNDKFDELVRPILGHDATMILQHQCWNADQLSVHDLILK